MAPRKLRGKCDIAWSPNGSTNWHTCCAPVKRGKKHVHRCAHGPMPRGWIGARRKGPGDNRYDIIGKTDDILDEEGKDAKATGDK